MCDFHEPPDGEENEVWNAWCFVVGARPGKTFAAFKTVYNAARSKADKGAKQGVVEYVRNWVHTHKSDDYLVRRLDWLFCGGPCPPEEYEDGDE